MQLHVVAQFEICILQGVTPKSPRSYQRAEGSPVAHSLVAGDPSLRLKHGYAQDDAVDGRRCHQKFKMSHYPITTARLPLKPWRSCGAIDLNRFGLGVSSRGHVGRRLIEGPSRLVGTLLVRRAGFPDRVMPTIVPADSSLAVNQGPGPVR
jgi:hypothetical protein